VVPDVGGAREVVTDPAHGRLVAPDPAAIAAGIADLLAAPPDPAAVATGAARFSWEANAAGLYDHLRSLGGR
jgi:glycosyltransferase involved in cell wall biosynthesis